MGGWSKLEGCNSFQKIESSSNESVGNEERKLKSSFDELISVFIEENNCGKSYYRPLPPMLGNGHSVDLLKLYFVVKLKGGFDAISRKRIWDEVGLLYGLGFGFGPSLKLIYVKYLDSVETWLVKLSRVETGARQVWSKGVLMGLGSEYGRFVSSMMEKMRKNDESFKEEKSGVTFIDLAQEQEQEDNDNESDKFKWNKFVISFVDSMEENEGVDDDGVELKQEAEMNSVDGVGFMGESHDESLKQTKSEMSFVGVFSSDLSDDGRSSVDPIVSDNVIKSSENSSDSKKGSTGDEELVMDSGVLREVLSLKRKRECFSGMLGWMVKAARNPTDLNNGTIPESSKWALYGNDNCWKQVLLIREALFLRKSTEQSVHQKKHKMHPSMFDDNERSRSSPRLFYEKYPNAPPVELSSIDIGCPRQRLEARLDMQPTASIYTCRPQQRIPIGHDFQVEVSKWTGVVTESDSKWLGTRVWPLERRENTYLDERDYIGKGREDDCGCLFPGTLECVKFHVAKRRTKLKFELASAFYSWKFDKMGEDCTISWSSEEEKKFKSVVKANPFSGQKRFWKQLCEVLPQKSWVDQVNYYYNVFVLRRRAFQNRHTPRSIDSDDDETDYGSTSNSLAAGSCSSIFSPKKAHTNTR